MTEGACRRRTEVNADRRHISRQAQLQDCRSLVRSGGPPRRPERRFWTAATATFAPTRRQAVDEASSICKRRLVITWSVFERERPDLAAVGSTLLYQFGMGLGFLATVRADGGPRLHPI